MNKISKRLESLTSYVDVKDSIIDVGCDHGYLSIYLKENKLCKNIIARDVNKNALSSAINNIKNSKLDIDTYLSDGIKDVPMKGVNTLVISGMGTSTIKHILDDQSKLKHINKLIIQSNNDHMILRSFMNDIGYYLSDEKAVYDKGKWYLTCLFIKSDKVNTKNQIEYGYLSDDMYNMHQIDELKRIIKKIPLFSSSRFKKCFELYKLKKAIRNR